MCLSLCLSVSPQTEDRQREFAMAAASVGDSLGIALAGLAAFPVHRYFCSLWAAHTAAARWIRQTWELFIWRFIFSLIWETLWQKQTFLLHETEEVQTHCHSTSAEFQVLKFSFLTSFYLWLQKSVLLMPHIFRAGFLLKCWCMWRILHNIKT